MRVRLPDSLVLRGGLMRDGSEFGDEFVNAPSFLGQRPPRRRTFLGGWIEVRFEPPKGDAADFSLDFEAVGTDESLVWGGGQIFPMLRNRLQPLKRLPGGKTGVNQGTLNLRTGFVEKDSIRLSAAFQNSLIGAVGALNRIPFAFPFMYPAPRWPLELPDLDAAGAEQPREEFAGIVFGADRWGRIVSLQINAETNFPVSILPRLGLFAPFAFGRGGRFYFGNPSGSLPDTPAGICPTAETAPDGILLDPPAFFRPHLSLRSDTLHEAPSTKPVRFQAPLAEQAVAVGLDTRIMVAGGIRDGTVWDRAFVSDRSGGEWREITRLPQGVWAAGAAVWRDSVYVAGGRDAAGKPTRSLQIYHAREDRWFEGPCLPHPAAAAAVGVIGGRLIVAGGWTCREGRPAIAGQVQVFDLESRTWSLLDPMLLPVAEGAAVVVDDELWVINGAVAEGRNTARVSAFSMKDGRWGALPSSPDAVRRAAVVELGGKLLRVGGYDEQGRPVRSVLEYDNAAGQWRPELPCPLPVAGASAVIHGGGKVLVIGGYEARPGTVRDVLAPVQCLEAGSGWSVGPGTVFSAQDVYSGSSGAAAPRALAPGARATIVSRYLALGSSRKELAVSVEGVAAEVVRARGNLIEFVVPPTLAASPCRRRVPLRLVAGGQCWEVDCPLCPCSPSVYVLNYARTQDDPWDHAEIGYLHRASALAANDDGSLNCPNQPARLGSRLWIYATGLREDDEFCVRCQGRELTAPALARHPHGLAGVVAIAVTIPRDLPPAHGVLHELQVSAAGIASNLVTVSIAEVEPLGVARTPVTAGLRSVFGGRFWGNAGSPATPPAPGSAGSR